MLAAASGLPTLSSDGVRFVKRVYEAFLANATWPPEMELRRSLAQDDELEIFRAGLDLGDWFVLFHADGQNGVALHLAAIAAAYPDAPVIREFELLLQLTIARWKERGAPPRLEDRDLASAGLPRERMKYLDQFFERNVFLTGPSGNDAGYYYDINLGIEPYLKAASLQQFLTILWSFTDESSFRAAYALLRIADDDEDYLAWRTLLALFVGIGPGTIGALSYVGPGHLVTAIRAIATTNTRVRTLSDLALTARERLRGTGTRAAAWTALEEVLGGILPGSTMATWQNRVDEVTLESEPAD